MGGPGGMGGPGNMGGPGPGMMGGMRPMGPGMMSGGMQPGMQGQGAMGGMGMQNNMGSGEMNRGLWTILTNIIVFRHDVRNAGRHAARSRRQSADGPPTAG